LTSAADCGQRESDSGHAQYMRSDKECSVLEASVVLRPDLMVPFSVSSNCSRSHASWSRGLDNAKSTNIVHSVITLDSSIRALLLTYLYTAQRNFS